MRRKLQEPVYGRGFGCVTEGSPLKGLLQGTGVSGSGSVVGDV